MTYLSEKLKIHFVFLFILSLYYLIPFFLTGNLILNPHDLLDSEIVYNDVIGKLYKGNTESTDVFLGGEIKWYFLRRVLQPLTLIYFLFESEAAFWLTDVLLRVIAYISFFKLTKKLDVSIFNSSLISCLFASTVQTHFGLGIVCLPYIIYLLLKNKKFFLKHYLIIILIGLNTDLAYHIYIIPVSFLISLIFYKNLKEYNYTLFLKISFILLICILISNSNLIYAQLFSDAFHRTEWINETPDLMSNIKIFIFGFLSLPIIKNSPYFFHSLPFMIFASSITFISFFAKNKKTYFLLLIIFIILLNSFVLNLDYVNQVRSDSSGLLKTINLHSVQHYLPLFRVLLFVSIINLLISKKTKYAIYTIIFISIISQQIRFSIIPIGKNYFSFEYLSTQDQSILKDYFHTQQYISLVKKIISLKNNEIENLDYKFKSNYTFSGYYNYDDYKKIKSYVGNNRTLSIGLDPMIAVMNDISVIDGYHNLYPLSYKNKFRKVIEKQLDYYDEWKKYYDNWGSRVYTFVYDPKIIKINFSEAKKLGASYVISKYIISNEILSTVCEKCNGSKDLFLYKIN